MLKELIQRFGHDKVNALTKYPHIPNFHMMGLNGVLTPRVQVPLLTSGIALLPGYNLYRIVEKIDGVHVRILIYNDEFIIGSRDTLHYHNHDIFYNPDQKIVDAVLRMDKPLPLWNGFMVIYGELFGRYIGKNGFEYCKNINSVKHDEEIDTVGFRVFDIGCFYREHLNLLYKTQEDIASWREAEKCEQLNPFIRRDDDKDIAIPFEYVPEIKVDENLKFKILSLQNKSFEEILQFMETILPRSTVCLDDNAQGKPEGIIIRDNSRNRIAKLHFQDYKFTIQVKNGEYK